MSDQGVREIQLNGKQLVFMFMTATVAAVVIFLCGVMVGRGVNTTRVSAATSVAAEPTIDPDRPCPGTAKLAPRKRPVRGAGLQPGRSQGTDLRQAARGAGAAARARRRTGCAARSGRRNQGRAPPVVPTATKAVDPTKSVDAAKAVDPGEPKGNGFVVQVASLRSRDEADAIARRLSSKGFPSFVSTPGVERSTRVPRPRRQSTRDRGEAETVARRLEKEEQFKPWITR